MDESQVHASSRNPPILPLLPSAFLPFSLPLFCNPTPIRFHPSPHLSLSPLAIRSHPASTLFSLILRTEEYPSSRNSLISSSRSLAMAQVVEKNIGYCYEEEFISDARGLKLFTCRWLPKNRDPKALVFLCHGYAMECSISMKGTGILLAEAGYAVYGVDYEGHGKSSGLQGYVQSFDALVNDCSEYFSGICERPENRKKKRFLLGESMGGAVALLLHRKKPAFWDGAVLVAPMCKIADEMKPHPIVTNILTKLCKVIPTWKIVPTQDVIDTAIKSPERRMEVRNNPYCYKGKPRLKTAHELLMVSLDVEKKLNEVSMPFIIVHGGDDRVTDPSISRLLYESASSTDKTFKLYPGMWHALTSGEPPENIQLVFSDIISWLDERSTVAVVSSRSEMEQKAEHDRQSLPSDGKKSTAKPC